jgi:hypothetical protein
MEALIVVTPVNDMSPRAIPTTTSVHRARWRRRLASVSRA